MKLCQKKQEELKPHRHKVHEGRSTKERIFHLPGSPSETPSGTPSELFHGTSGKRKGNLLQNRYPVLENIQLCAFVVQISLP